MENDDSKENPSQSRAAGKEPSQSVRLVKETAKKSAFNQFLFVILWVTISLLGIIIYSKVLTLPGMSHEILKPMEYICLFVGLLGVLVINFTPPWRVSPLSSMTSSLSHDLKLTRISKHAFMIPQLASISAFACDAYRASINSNKYAFNCDIIVIGSLVFLCLQSARGKKMMMLGISMVLSLVMLLVCLLGAFASLHPNGPFAADSKSVPVLICLEAAIFLCSLISLLLRYIEVRIEPPQPSNPVQP
ncbi:MAG TPA: hypothetical protein VMG59_03720 [Phycisphaerae bacterium]|nr:hypothetical protein [Phycisphaerae bacterium]